MVIPEHWLTADCLAAATGAPPRRRSIQVFRNPLIDRWLARAHPAFPAIFFGPAGVGALAASWWFLGLAGAGAAFLGGWMAFSLFEYALHRFVFHKVFPDTRAGQIAWFMAHGYHHTYPTDPDRLVMPPLGSVPLVAMFLAAYLLALGPGAGLGALAGTLAGYIVYDSMHYLMHHRPPRTAVGAWLRRYHNLHHHVDEPTRYGVSSPVWDLVFRTYSPVHRARRGTRRGDAGSLLAAARASAPSRSAGSGSP